MRERFRRPLLFLITIGAGSLIVLIDASIEVILAGTVLAGFLALVITGAIDLAKLSPSHLLKRSKTTKEEEPEPPAEKPSSTRRLLPGGMLGAFTSSIRETIAHARTPEAEKKGKIGEIDAMLDAAVDGKAPDQPGIDAADPLASLADIDFDSLADFDPDGEPSGPGTAIEPDRISADAVSEILKAHQSDLDGTSIASGAGPAAIPPDMSALSEELSMLDNLDLGEIEIEGEEKEEIDANDPVPDEEPPEEEAQEEEEFDMISFASGGTVDDDLISSLKSDSKKKKFVEDVSLVRDLKGEKFDARSLAVELEEILAVMRSQR